MWLVRSPSWHLAASLSGSEPVKLTLSVFCTPLPLDSMTFLNSTTRSRLHPVACFEWEVVRRGPVPVPAACRAPAAAFVGVPLSAAPHALARSVAAEAGEGRPRTIRLPPSEFPICIELSVVEAALAPTCAQSRTASRASPSTSRCARPAFWHTAAAARNVAAAPDAVLVK